MDDDVGKFLRLFTELPIDECERLEKLKGSEINYAKQILATEVTGLAHGKEAALNAAKTAKNVFDDGSSSEGLPTTFLSEEDVSNGLTVAQLFTRSGLSNSGKDAKRLIVDGGAKINDEIITDPSKTYVLYELSEGLKLSAGKKRHSMVRIK
jgi:tyrosyl-tRNA synthetase